MKVNWQTRLRHPAFYAAIVALLGLIVTDVGLIDLGRFEMYAQMLLAVFVAAGVIADPTTEGVSDSEQALTYPKPKPKDGGEDGSKFY